MFKLLRKRSSSSRDGNDEAMAPQDAIQYKGDLLEHYNLRELYDGVIMTRRMTKKKKKEEGTVSGSAEGAAVEEVEEIVPAPLPPRKVGKATYFVYHSIPGDGHLRANPDDEARTAAERGESHASATGMRSSGSNSNKYDLAPLGEVRKSAQEVKLRPLGGKHIREAFPLKPGHFELSKVS